MRALLVIALLLLAGCTSGSKGPVETSSREMLPQADKAARALDAGARFMSATMIETTDPAAFLAQHRMEFPEARQVKPETATGDQANLVLILMQVDGTRPDGKAGDGRAQRAAYLYEGAGTLVGVVIAADGSTVYAKKWNVAGKGRGVFSWSVDSSAASNTLAGKNTNFAFLRDHGHIAIWDLVKPDPGNAYWQVGLLRATPAAGWTNDPHMDGDAPDYCELATPKVDAATGIVLSSGSLHTRSAGKGTASSCDA